MSDNFKLYTNIESFIDDNCAYKKNEPFVIKYIKENENSKGLPKVQDNKNCIQCIMNIPKEKEFILKDNQNANGITITILNSSFEFVLYKNDSNPSLIKCLLLLIINDIEKCDKQETEIKSDKNISDINNEYQLLEKLKKFIFTYIKKNRKKKKNSSDETSNNDLEAILLAGAKNDLRFFNCDNNGINYEDENIKKNIEIIKSISSKLEIKQKKSEKEKTNKKSEDNEEGKEVNKNGKKESDNDLNEVLDELNPDYKNELIYRYLDEMPEEIVNLMKKYRNINFTKNMYMEYIDKNKNINNNGEEKEN